MITTDDQEGSIIMRKNHCEKIIAHACTEVGIVCAAMTCEHKRAKSQIEEIQARMIVELGKVYEVEYSRHDAIVRAHSILFRAVGVTISRGVRRILPSQVKPVLDGATATVLTRIMGNLVMMELSSTQQQYHHHHRRKQHHHRHYNEQHHNRHYHK